MTGDPHALANQCLALSIQIKALEAQHSEIRDQLKRILLGEATAPPPGGWVYGPVTVQYVAPSERTTISRKKLAQNGVALDVIVKSMDVTTMAPTIRVVATKEGSDGA